MVAYPSDNTLMVHLFYFHLIKELRLNSPLKLRVKFEEMGPVEGIR